MSLLNSDTQELLFATIVKTAKTKGRCSFQCFQLVRDNLLSHTFTATLDTNNGLRIQGPKRLFSWKNFVAQFDLIHFLSSSSPPMGKEIAIKLLRDRDSIRARARAERDVKAPTLQRRPEVPLAIPPPRYLEKEFQTPSNAQNFSKSSAAATARAEYTEVANAPLHNCSEAVKPLLSTQKRHSDEINALGLGLDELKGRLEGTIAHMREAMQVMSMQIRALLRRQTELEAELRFMREEKQRFEVQAAVPPRVQETDNAGAENPSQHHSYFPGVVDAVLLNQEPDADTPWGHPTTIKTPDVQEAVAHCHEDHFPQVETKHEENSNLFSDINKAVLGAHDWILWARTVPSQMLPAAILPRLCFTCCKVYPALSDALASFTTWVYSSLEFPLECIAPHSFFVETGRRLLVDLVVAIEAQVRRQNCCQATLRKEAFALCVSAVSAHAPVQSFVAPGTPSASAEVEQMTTPTIPSFTQFDNLSEAPFGNLDIHLDGSADQHVESHLQASLGFLPSADYAESTSPLPQIVYQDSLPEQRIGCLSNGSGASAGEDRSDVNGVVENVQQSHFASENSIEEDSLKACGADSPVIGDTAKPTEAAAVSIPQDIMSADRTEVHEGGTRQRCAERSSPFVEYSDDDDISAEEEFIESVKNVSSESADGAGLARQAEWRLHNWVDEDWMGGVMHNEGVSACGPFTPPVPLPTIATAEQESTIPLADIVTTPMDVEKLRSDMSAAFQSRFDALMRLVCSPPECTFGETPYRIPMCDAKFLLACGVIGKVPAKGEKHTQGWFAPVSVVREGNAGLCRQWVACPVEKNDLDEYASRIPPVPHNRIWETVCQEAATVFTFGHACYQLELPPKARRHFRARLADGTLVELTRLPPAHKASPEIVHIISLVLADLGIATEVDTIISPTSARVQVLVNTVRLAGSKPLVDKSAANLRERATKVNAIITSSKSEGCRYVFLGVEYDHSNHTIKLAKRQVKQIQQASSISAFSIDDFSQLVLKLQYACSVLGIDMLPYYPLIKARAQQLARAVDSPSPCLANPSPFILRLLRGLTLRVKRNCPREMGHQAVQEHQKASIVLDLSNEYWRAYLFKQNGEVHAIYGKWERPKNGEVKASFVVMLIELLGDNLPKTVRIWVDTAPMGYNPHIVFPKEIPMPFVERSTPETLEVLKEYELRYSKIPNDDPGEERVKSEQEYKADLEESFKSLSKASCARERWSISVKVT